MNFQPEVFFRSPPKDPHSINFFIDGNTTLHIFLALAKILKYGVSIKYARGNVVNFDYVPECELFTMRRYFNSLGIELLWRWLGAADHLESVKDACKLSEYKLIVDINNRKLEIYFDYLKKPSIIYKIL